MSRIHDALKKAEQERATGSSDAGVGVVPEEHAPAGAAAPVPPPGVLTASAARREASVAPLTLAALTARCAQPRWSPDRKMMLLFNSQDHAHGTEELRTLRSRLYQIRDHQPLRSVLITSPLPGEGKTFLAANLAQVIARQHERHALLIDADLRRSNLHVCLGAPSAPGLTEYLGGEADEFTVIQRSPIPNLFFLPGGKTVANPAELIGNGRLKSLLERLAPAFDWIILDSPPVVPVADASMVADLCDGVLLVLRAASTPLDAARKVREEFRDKRLLGAVLNCVEAGHGYSSYYYYQSGAPSGTKPAAGKQG